MATRPILPVAEEVIATILGELEVPVWASSPVETSGRPWPEEFVVIWRTGGGARNRVLDLAQVTVMCWAPTQQRAAALATRARDVLLWAATGSAHPLVRRVADVSGVYFDPDPDRDDRSRYTVTLDVTLRAARQPA